MGRGARVAGRDVGCKARRDPRPGRGPGPGSLTQDATRSRVWGRRAKLTGSRAAPARPAPNEAPSMAGPGGTRAPGTLGLSVRPAGRPRPRPPGCAAEAAGAAAAAAASRERAPAATGARGAGPSPCPPPTGPRAGLKPIPRSAAPPTPRSPARAGSEMGDHPQAPKRGTGGLGTESTTAPYRRSQESARAAARGRDRQT